MKKIDIDYHSIVWANLLAALAGCSSYSKNEQMDHPPLAQESVMHPCANAYQHKFETAREFDDLLEKVYILFEILKQCCRYIDAHKSHYTIGNITKIDKELHKKQHQNPQQQHALMLYNATNCIDDPNIALDKIINSKQKHAKILKKLLCNQLMQSAVPGQTAKLFAKQETKHAPSHKHPIEKFSNQVADYLEQHLLPYWGKLVEWFMLYGLNINIAQGAIEPKAAKKIYETACAAIEGIYNEKNIEYFEKYFYTERKSARQHSPIESMQKLEKYRLQPIKKMYAKLSLLLSKIKYSNDELRTTLTDSLTMFYNIAYVFGITDLLFILGIEAMDLLKFNVYLTDFIENNHTTLHQINTKVKELTNCSIALLKLEAKQP